MPRAPTPVSSFGPELLTALLAGAKQRHVIGPIQYRTAVKFRQRIYQLRHAMRQEHHPMAELVSRTRIQIIWPEDTPTRRSSKGIMWPSDPATPCEVVISPNDSEFSDVLAKSGIKTTELPDDILDSNPQTPAAFKGYGDDT